MNIKSILRFSYKSLLGALLVATTTSCLQSLDDVKVSAGDQASVSFVLRVPGEVPTSTTRGLSADNETNIQTIDVLLFRSTSSGKVFYKALQGRNISNTSGNVKGFTVNIPIGDYNTFDIEVLANARSMLVDATLVPGADKQATLDQLTVNHSADAKWVESTIPMWGEITDTQVSDNSTYPMKLTRMVSRIDVKLSAAAAGTSNSNFSINSVLLYNYSTTGTVVPNISTSWSASSQKVTAPTAPSSGYGTTQGPLTYTSSDQYTDAHFLPDSLMRAIYTFEAPAGTAGAGTNPCLVVSGYYNGSTTETFYKIEFVSTTDAQEPVYLPLLRNYRYTVTINAITQAGSATADAAFASNAVNLSASILSVEEGDLADIAFDNDNYLALSAHEFTLPNRVDTLPNANNAVLIKTDYADGWTGEVFDDEACTRQTSASGWLNLYSKTSGIAASDSTYGAKTGGINENGDTLRLYVTTENFDTSSERTAYVKVTAGKLMWVLRVHQQTGGGLWAYSNVYLDSSTGQLTFATEPDSVKARYQGVFFGRGALMATPPVTGSLTSSSSLAFIPSEYKGAVPTNIKDVPYDTLDTKDIIGFDASAATGDICRYISSKGWVSGSWRMPTTEDLSSFSTSTTGNPFWVDGTFDTPVANGTAICNAGLSAVSRFFPAGGSYQYDATYGKPKDDISSYGQTGAYWGISQPYGLGFTNGLLTTTLNSGTYDNYPIRCVRDLNPYLNVSPQSHTFPASGGSQEFDVYTANVTGSYTASSNASWLTVTSSGNKLTVKADVSTTPTTRTATVTVSASGATDVTVAITQEKAAPQFAYSNIYLGADQQLVFATENNEYIAQNQGLLFKWGSLMGISPSSAITGSAAFDVEDVQFIPGEYSGSSIKTWDNVSYTNGTTDNTATDQFTTTYGSIGYDATQAKGDICRYISVKGWVEGCWRMPTDKELQDFCSVNSVTGSWSAVSNTNGDGSTGITSGYHFGSGSSQRYFPATGQRDSQGTLANVGTNGYYWSVSPAGSGNGYDLTFGSSSVNSTDHTAVTNAYPIRCIQELNPYVFAIPSSYTFTSDGGSTNFNIYTVNITVSSFSYDKSGDSSDTDATWLTLSPNGNTLTVQAASNGSTTVARTATITISAPGVSNITIPITQAGVPTTLSANPPTVNVGYGGGNASTTVSTNVATGWTASTTDSWITVTKGSGANGENVTFSVQANSSTLARTGGILLQASGAKDFTINVSQAGVPVTLSVNPASVSVGYEASSGSATVSTNVTAGWSASTSDTWITLTKSSGISGESVTFSTQATTLFTTRAGTITLSAGGITTALTVNQAALPIATFAYSNIYISDGHPTFATSPDDTKSKYQGIYFKWGSLIGISPDGSDHISYSKKKVEFTPSEYSGSSINDNWSSVPYTTENNVADNPDENYFLTVYGTIGYNAATGQGDICRYISDKNWVSGRWRMPTANECQRLYLLAESSVGSGIKLTNVNKSGTTSIDTGWSMGSGNSQRFFPAGGRRILSDGSTMSYWGMDGYYWTASPAITPVSNMASEFDFNMSNTPTINFSEEETSDGHTIRCVQDE
jgi:hypothetical protein